MTCLKIRYQSEKIRNPITNVINNLCKNYLNFGFSRKYRLIDFKRKIWKMASIIIYNEYDPNRTSLISLTCFPNGMLSYIICTEGLFSGDGIITGIGLMPRKGSSLPLIDIPEGNSIHSIEIRPNLRFSFVRSAGTFAIIVKKFFRLKKILLRLPSKEEILVDQNIFATLGQVSRPNLKFEAIHKAGWNRYKGKRPKVRGVAKNPVDHPHGGGGGKCQVTPKAKIAKNVSTKDPKRRFVYFLVTQSRKKKRRKRK
jgi:large subunit ribosomal protein L2